MRKPNFLVPLSFPTTGILKVAREKDKISEKAKSRKIRVIFD